MGFRENLKSELAYSGMMVKELAALSGVSKYTLDSYLSARGQVPSVEAAARIARALGVSIEYLVSGEEAGRAVSPAGTARLSREARTAALLVEGLDAANRAFVLDFIRWMKSREDADRACGPAAPAGRRRT